MHTKKGIKNMKVLRINDGKGQFLYNPLNIVGEPNDSDYKNVDLIEKEDVLSILALMIDEEIAMDEYDEENPLPNPVHDIIYKNLYSKFKNISDNKEAIKKEIDDKFSSAETKYNQ